MADNIAVIFGAKVMGKCALLSILIVMLLITSCTQRPSETPMIGQDEQPAPATETPAPTTTPETQLTETTSDPGLLKVVGQIGGPTQAVAVEGDYAYVGIGRRLIVLDVSDPTSPSEVGTTEPFGWHVEDVVVAGSTAFVAAGGAGLYIADVSTPARPTVVGSLDTQGYTESVAVDGNYAYVADGPAGLRVVDISDLARPVEVGHTYTLNYAFDLAVEGRYAYIAAAGVGLLVADVSNPTKPREVGNLATPGYAYGVAVSGITAYVADGWEGLKVLDVSMPSDPVEIGSLKTPGWAFGVAIQDSVAYVADGWGGIILVDVTEPTNPRAPTGVKWDGQPRELFALSLAVRGNLAYVADPYLGLRAIDVADPRTPEVGSYAPLSFAGRVALASGYAFVTGVHGSFKALRIIDVADPSRPGQVGAVLALTPYAMVAAGDLAYVLAAATVEEAWQEGLYILDISDPVQPRLISYQGLIAPGVSMVLRDGIAYVTTEWSFELVDISEPSSPSKLAVVDFTGGLGRGAGASVVNDLALSGTIAYATDSVQGLIVIDVADPTNPRVTTSYKPPELLKPMSIAIDGNYAFLGDHGRLVVVDISKVDAPSVAATVPLPGVGENLALEENLLYVAAGPEGLIVLDVADPLSPIIVTSQWLPGSSYGVAVDADHIYVGSGEAGLFILGRPGSASPSSKISGARFDGTSMSIAADMAFSPVALSSPLPLVAGHSSSLEAGYERGAPRLNTNLSQDGALQPAPLVAPESGQTRTVTSAADSGPGSLRWALESASGGDVISFDPAVFPPERPSTIQVTSPLPYLNQGSLTIDASDAGVVLDGSRAPEGTHGIVITSDYNTVKGLQVLRFPGAGIGIGGGSFNTIGGDRGRGIGPSGEGNVISGNKIVGVGLAPCAAGVASDIGAEKCEGMSAYNLLVGNYIGPDVTGTQQVGSQGTGVFVWGNSPHNTIGGSTPADRNVISGNTRAGVTFMGSSGNTVVGNYIGTDASGTKALGNRWSGLTIESGAANIVARNVISGNGMAGVKIGDKGAFGNDIVGNFIGTDITGTIALGNGEGIHVNESFNRIGGTVPEERNVISGNLGVGIKIGWQSKGVMVIGNYVGTDVTGTKTLGNGSDGVRLTEGAYHNFIGGTTEAERNIIGGNQDSGISLQGTGVRYNVIAGNYIGTGLDGGTALPNQSGVVFQSAGYNFVKSNLVAYNREAGIAIPSGVGNRIHHNRIMNNGTNGVDRGKDNHWDDDSQGNYWSNCKGKDEDGDGIGDTPHPVPPNGVDNYPLMKPHDHLPSP